MKNIRVKYYPQHLDYERHSNEFRPFVTSFGESNYRSNALNTDQLGFRLQFNETGEAVDFYSVKDKVSSCNLLIGGSTVFGVDCSSDTKTFANIINQSGIPIFNWGLRGALCQQELITFLFQKYLLPDIKNIIIFSGANDASLACLKGDFLYPEWGSVFSEDVFFRRYSGQYVENTRSFLKNKKVVSWVENILISGGWKSNLLTWLAPNMPSRDTRTEGFPLTESERYQVTAGHLRNCLKTWDLIAKSTGISVHFVLQPLLGWTTKRPSVRESNLVSSDIEAIPELAKMCSPDFYRRFKSTLIESFANTGINFHDANLWLSDSRYDNEDIFTDMCHFNDRGNELIAYLLIKNILEV